MYVKMNVGDRAIIFRLTKKISENIKGKELTLFFKNNYQVFLLERIE
jgi:hypothetical protein